MEPVYLILLTFIMWFISLCVLFLFLYLHINFRAHTPGINSTNSRCFCSALKCPSKSEWLRVHMCVFTVGDGICARWIFWCSAFLSMPRQQAEVNTHANSNVNKKEPSYSCKLFFPSSCWWIYLWTKEK